MINTKNEKYTARLLERNTWWKRLLDVQRPYRMHLQRLNLGFVLDVGCGVGRNLINLTGVSPAVGVDHNKHSVAIAKSRGLNAFTPEEFLDTPYAEPSSFDSLLLSHVAEHMRYDEAL